MTVIDAALVMMRNHRHPDTIAAYLAHEINQCKAAAEEFVASFIAAEAHARQYDQETQS